MAIYTKKPNIELQDCCFPPIGHEGLGLHGGGGGGGNGFVV